MTMIGRPLASGAPKIVSLTAAGTSTVRVG